MLMLILDLLSSGIWIAIEKKMKKRKRNLACANIRRGVLIHHIIFHIIV